MPRRLLQIHEDLETLIKRFAPDVMAIEELFFNTNVTTGIGVAQARGVILMTAAQLGVTVYEYTPSQVKQAVVGYGKAEKRQVMDMTSTAAPSGSCAQAGRRGRRSGHRPVPRPVPHLPAEPAVTGRREFPCFTISRAERPSLAPNLAVIDCGGVGYACRTTSYTLSWTPDGTRGNPLYPSQCPGGRHGALRLWNGTGAQLLSSCSLASPVWGPRPRCPFSPPPPRRDWPPPSLPATKRP